MSDTTSDPIITTLAVYTWPVLFSTVVGLIVWIWKERAFERAANKFEQAVNLVRANFGQAISSHRELQDAAHQKVLDRVASLERTVFGIDGGNGLRADMKKVKHGIRALLLMRQPGNAAAEETDVQALMAELE